MTSYILIKSQNQVVANDLMKAIWIKTEGKGQALKKGLLFLGRKGGTEGRGDRNRPLFLSSERRIVSIS